MRNDDMKPDRQDCYSSVTVVKTKTKAHIHLQGALDSLKRNSLLAFNDTVCYLLSLVILIVYNDLIHEIPPTLQMP